MSLFHTDDVVHPGALAYSPIALASAQDQRTEENSKRGWLGALGTRQELS